MTDDNPQDPRPPTVDLRVPPGVSMTPAYPSRPTDDWLARLLFPASEAKSWLKFIGAVCIALGALQALTIFGLVVAWLYIWLGVLLWQAGDRAGMAAQLNDAGLLEQYLQKIKTIVVIVGVLVAIGMVMTVISFIMVFAFGWLATLMEIFPG